MSPRRSSPEGVLERHARSCARSQDRRCSCTPSYQAYAPTGVRGDDHGQRFDVLPLTVLTESMAEAVGFDRRRFRPNIVIAGAEGLAEVDWPGYGLRAGSVLIGVRNRRMRCVMTTLDPDTLEQDIGVFQHIYREFGGEVALDCWVVEPGRIGVGDAVEIVELPVGSEPPIGNGDDSFDWRRRALA